jgi:hypothetical protein
VYDVDITVPHTGPEATIKFTTNLNSAATDESFAIDDFQLAPL